MRVHQVLMLVSLQAAVSVGGAEPADLGLAGLNISDAVTVVAGGLESVLRQATGLALLAGSSVSM